MSIDYRFFRPIGVLSIFASLPILEAALQAARAFVHLGDYLRLLLSLLFGRLLNVPTSDSFFIGLNSELASATYARGSSSGHRSPLCSFLFVPFTSVEPQICR